MNYRKPFFVLLAGVLLLSAAPGRSQTFENPSIQGSSSFAVITDSRTARECRPQMTAYKQTLEAEGLPVYIVSHDWTTPEQVRETLLRKLSSRETKAFLAKVLQSRERFSVLG